MNPQQEAAAHRLLALLESDPEAVADCNSYGNWFTHLVDHLSDLEIDRIREARK
jgi:hypothetical protein